MTLEELEKLEESEHDLALEIIALLLLLGDSYTKAVRELVGRWFRKYSENGTYTFNQARKILTRKELKAFNKEMGTDFKRLTRQRALRYRIQAKMADFMVDGTKHIDNLVAGISAKETEFFQVSDDIGGVSDEKWGVDNKSPKSRFNNRVINTSVKLQTEVERAMFITGKAETAEEAADDEMQKMMTALSLLLLTEGVATSSIVRKRIFKFKGYSHYKFVALRDERMCKVCGSLHGTVFPIEAYEIGVTASPIHPRCRCIEVPVIK